MMVVERKGKEIKPCCRGGREKGSFKNKCSLRRRGKDVLKRGRTSYVKRREGEKANINRMGWKVEGGKSKERTFVVSLPY
jgi:hypothetical protein